jgi:mRNA interferase MazF
MARILRGEIYWADLAPTKGREQAGQRPVLILSQDIFNERSGTVIAMALTSQTQKAGFPFALELSDSALPKRSWIKISQMRTISTERLGKRVTKLPEKDLDLAIEGLKEIRKQKSISSGNNNISRGEIARLTRPGFNKDKTAAMVEADLQADAEMGVGYRVYLQKSPETGKWIITGADRTRMY